MTMWGVYGAPGNGKGVISVQICDAIGRAYGGLPVYANSELNIPGAITHEKLTVDEFMELDARPELDKLGHKGDLTKRGLAWITEPHAWGMDSRTGSSKLSRAMAKKGTQARHYGLDILYDTQIPSEIDRRFRFLSKVTILALEPVEDKNGNPVLFRYAYFGRYEQKVIKIDKKEFDRLKVMYNTEEHIDVEYSDDFYQKLAQNGDVDFSNLQERPDISKAVRNSRDATSGKPPSPKYHEEWNEEFQRMDRVYDN